MYYDINLVFNNTLGQFQIKGKINKLVKYQKWFIAKD